MYNKKHSPFRKRGGYKHGFLPEGYPNSKNEIFNITFGQARSINDLLVILKESFPSTTIK